MGQEEQQLGARSKRLSDKDVDEKRLKRRKEKESGLKSGNRLNSILISNLRYQDNLKEELIKAFSEFGTIKRGSDNDKLCKLYQDQQGNFEGKALIIYSHYESVALAVRAMDGSNFHDNAISVQETHSKGNKIRLKIKNTNNLQRDETDHNKQKSTKFKIKIRSRKEVKSSNNHEDRSSDRDDLDKIWRTTILDNLIDIYNIPNEPELDVIAEDILDGCKICGPIEDLKFIAELGRAEVTFIDHKQAQKCSKKMNKRFFGGRKLRAYMMDEGSNF